MRVAALSSLGDVRRSSVIPGCQQAGSPARAEPASPSPARFFPENAFSANARGLTPCSGRRSPALPARSGVQPGTGRCSAAPGPVAPRFVIHPRRSRSSGVPAGTWGPCSDAAASGGRHGLAPRRRAARPGAGGRGCRRAGLRLRGGSVAARGSPANPGCWFGGGEGEPGDSPGGPCDGGTLGAVSPAGAPSCSLLSLPSHLYLFNSFFLCGRTRR